MDNSVVKLSSKPWNTILIGTESYLNKGIFDASNERYEAAFYDSEALWVESVDREVLQDRFTKLNPNVEASLPYFIKDLQQRFLSKGQGDHFNLDKANGKLAVELKWKITGGVPFQWKFEFRRDDSQLSEQLVLPLFTMVNELLRRQSELSKILFRKDREIQDLKEQGVSVSRAQLETQEFNLQKFVERCNGCSEFQVVADSPPLKVFQNSICQDLYKHTMAKRSLSVEKELHEAPTQAIVDTEADYETGGTLSSPDQSSSNTSSPKKLDPTSPAKNMEMLRRDALKRRLAEEKEKQSKKKKKKTNL